MAAAPWQEHAYKVVVEFQKRNSGATRKIELTHGDTLPQQLYGRVDPQVRVLAEACLLACMHAGCMHVLAGAQAFALPQPSLVASSCHSGMARVHARRETTSH